MKGNETRGILTKADKKWLRGDIEYEHRQTAADRRADIRERVSLALQDFQYLTNNWSREEREKVAEDVDIADAEAMIAFVYLLLNERAQDAELLLSDEVDPADELFKFRRVLTNGIKRGKDRIGKAPNIVTINSNTELHELPSIPDIKSEMDMDHWRKANQNRQEVCYSMEEFFSEEDPETIDQTEAAENYRIALLSEIEKRLNSRRQKADSEIQRHDMEPPSYGLF